MLSHSSAVENLGGAERALLEFLDAWSMHTPELEPFVVARGPDGLLQPELRRRGIQTMNLDFESWVLPKRIVEVEDRYRTARRDFTALRALERLVREFKPDVVLTNTIVVPWAAIAAKLVGVPHVWFAHEFGTDHEFQIGIDETFDDIGVLSDLVVASSEHLRDYLAQWMPRERVEVLYPMPQLDFAPGAATATGGAGDAEPLKIVCVGRIAESKGQARIVRAIAILRDQGAECRVTFVGGGDVQERSRIVALANDLGIADAVTFTGEVDDPMPLVRDAEVGVVASDIEGFGRVTVEYMAAGIPVVAAAIGASPELVNDGETGFLFEAGSVEGLAESLGRYHRDRAMLAQHGAAARAHVMNELMSRHDAASVIGSIERSVASGSAPIHRLPHVVMTWLSLPGVASEMLTTSELMRDPRESREWRVGWRILKPAHQTKHVVAKLRGIVRK